MATFKVTFVSEGKVVEVDPARYPYGSHGEAGSILDIALAHGVMIEHACGGANVCGTCAVAIVAGMENLSKAGEDELDTIEQTTENKPDLRLACQAVVKGDVTVKTG